MKKFKLIFLYFFPCCLWGQSQIVSAEYFFGQDPGIGNATALNVQASNNLTVNFNIPVDNLHHGLHMLHLRVKNSSGLWGVYACKPFYILNLPNPQQLIIAAEYFISQDPGIGNANPIQIDQTYQLDNNYMLPLNDLSKGIHTLYVRVKNSDEKWSNFTKKNFYVNPELPKMKVVELEYFIDEDPGEGNATAGDITEGLSIDEIVNLSIPSAISAGEHILFTRVKNEIGNWSEAVTETFIVDEELNIISINHHLKLYPNPSKGMLFIEGQEHSAYELMVFNIQGKLVIRERRFENSLDLSHLPSGVYLVHLLNDQGVKNAKWVKE